MPTKYFICFLVGCFITAIMLTGAPSTFIKENAPIISIFTVLIQCWIIYRQTKISEKANEITLLLAQRAENDKKAEKQKEEQEKEKERIKKEKIKKEAEEHNKICASPIIIK